MTNGLNLKCVSSRLKNGGDFVSNIRWNTTVNNIPDMIRSIETINGKQIQVGVFEGENAWLAGIHEYGCDINVTQKMRAFLHAHGLHLSPNTTKIHIPERSFLRAGHDKYSDEVLEKVERAIGQVLNGQMSEQQFLDMAGRMLATKIKTYARDVSEPPNHPYTVEQKGSSNPLVDTGNMIEGITWRIE